MALQIAVTSTDPDKPTEIISVMTATGDDGWKYTDVDGDRIAVFTADINGTPGVYFRTDANGSSIPLADLEQFIDAVRETAKRAARTGQETAERQEGGQCPQNSGGEHAFRPVALDPGRFCTYCGNPEAGVR